MPALVVLLLVALTGCSSPAPAPAPSARDPAAARQSAAASRRRDPPPLPPSVLPAPPRLVAIGDVHGDLEALRGALRLAGAIDDADHWSGGSLWIVQTGDLLDRGDDEDEILALVARLEMEAEAAGGRFVSLHGNHELMNAQGDFRYVTPDGFADFEPFAGELPPALRARLPRARHGRAAAFAPGGSQALALAARNTVVVIGDTVFVHGGLAARHLDRGIDALNEDMRAYLLGAAPLSPSLRAEDGPVWHRAFASDTDATACAELEEVLARVQARRMVVGHTVQRDGVNAACDGRVWRIDVGLGRAYGGPLEVLELAGETARVLRGTR